MFFLSEYIIMFNLCVFTRVFRKNNLMYTVQSADIPVIYIGMTVDIYVKYVIRRTVIRGV
jgi:hypothetical protein